MTISRFRPLVLAAGLVASIPLLASAASAQPAPPSFDIVLAGGRVIDPETGLDAIRDVGIAGGSIVAISELPLAALVATDGVVIDASGLVVSPGFIDLHAHGQSPAANEYQAHDGVTTALELEWGYPRIAQWLASREGRARVNYGASVSHGMLRTLAIPGLEETAAQLDAVAALDDPLRALQGALSEGFYEPLPPDRVDELTALLDQGLREGGLGIGMAHQYYPGATRTEIFRVFQHAAARQAPIYTHVRSMGLDAIQEVLANAAATGAPLHIVHVNSSSLGDLPAVLELIAGARQRSVDVTTEAYPYTAGSTGIQTSIFDDGWQQRLGISYQDIQWQDTGERLTEETFELLREEGGTVIIHMMKPEMIELAMKTPFVMIASDGMPYAPGAHPRSAGTFSRVLGRYVREQGVLALPEAIRRMTLMPAQRLEGIAPAMTKKGRVQVGADADLTVFDPETILDTATFEDDLSFSVGVRHVLVGGVFVVRDGETVEGAFPGKAVVGKAAIP
ncbi:MAG TPA: amidohydrolase family protein [Thermoanaerobaculia bacterium]|nr:amidohydrolase family protein [Thermoanaerobaculia bacterium]